MPFGTVSGPSQKLDSEDASGLVHERRRGFLSGIRLHKGSVDNEITGWLGVGDPKEKEYHREILSPAFSDEVADTSIFDLLPMALPLPSTTASPSVTL
jgi:hypothetical protein